MNQLEKDMLDLLSDLKQNYNVSGLKAEFGNEATSLDEVIRLKNLASVLGLDLTIKISGCEALKDLHDVKILGAKNVVVPMIESPYAVKKFLNGVNAVFNQNEKNDMKFFINIETIYGIKYVDEILSSDLSNVISGIVFGRSDMVASLGMDQIDVENEIIYDYAKSLANQTFEYKKELIIGGGVSPLSIPFFKKINVSSFTCFETRKVIFDSEALANPNIAEGVIKAINFELLWLKNKQNFYNEISLEDKKRIENLESRCENSIKNYSPV